MKPRIKLICITGTPGTGKTHLARKLSLLLRYAYIDGSEIGKKASVGYDRGRKTRIVDPSLFTKEALKVRDLTSKQGFSGAILDSHLSHLLPKRAVNACIVLNCGLPELYRRLKKRGYSSAKIRENMDAEIFDTLFLEASEAGHKIIRVDATKLPDSAVKKLASSIRKL